MQTALEQLLAKQNLTFVVRENDLLILPKNDPAAKISLTYNVRGLLTDQLTMEGLVKLINKIITDDKSEEELKFDFHVREIDQNRLIIVGTEREQARVASLLNSLAPKR